MRTLTPTQIDFRIVYSTRTYNGLEVCPFSECSGGLSALFVGIWSVDSRSSWFKI